MTEPLSPIARLKRGYENWDWVDVGAAYHMLTGEKLPPREALSDAEGVLADIIFALGDRVSPLGPRTQKAPDTPPGPREEPPKKTKPQKKAAKHKPPKAPKQPPTNDTPPAKRPPQRKDEASRPSPSPDFSIVHGDAQQDPEKGKACKVLPMDLGPGEQGWKDNGKLHAEERAESEALSEKFEGKAYREEYEPVKVTCVRCGREDEVHPDEAPDGDSSYIHPACLRKR